MLSRARGSQAPPRSGADVGRVPLPRLHSQLAKRHIPPHRRSELDASNVTLGDRHQVVWQRRHRRQRSRNLRAALEQLLEASGNLSPIS